MSLKLVPDDPIDTNLSLVQKMAWHQTGDKALSEPIVDKFTDT